MTLEQKDIFLWHDCLDCSSLDNRDCPLEGTTSAEKIVDRTKKPDDFCCTRFLEN
jgi:hypothetical protein